MIYSSWDIGRDRLKLVILGYFLHFYSPKNPKNQNFQTKKIAVPKITIIWCTVPEIQSEADGILCHFVSFCAPPPQNDTKFCTTNGTQQTEFFDKQNSLTFWVIFCLFNTLTICKIKILKNEENAWRCYHLTNPYHKWQSHDVWFPRYEVQPTYFFVILDCFLPFYPSPPPPHTHTHPKKSQFWNNEKKTWRYYNFTHVCHIAIIWCMVWSMTDQIFCHFGPIFAFYLTNDPKNQNFKKWKNHTQVKVGHTSEFLLDINWWTWKTTIKRTVEPIKNVRILIFTIMYFKKK